MLLHGTFAALLLLSVRFQGESGKMLNEKVFFIDLQSGAENPSPTVTKDVTLKTTAVKKIHKAPAVILENREHDEKIIVKASLSEDTEAGHTESLSIDTGYTSGMAIVSDSISSGEEAGYTDSAQGGDETIISSKATDDKRGGLTESDALKLISTAIERAKTYPGMARRRGIEGTVYVSFRIGHAGEPDEIEVSKSSGYKMLDEATMKVIRKAAPYPHIDERVEVPVTYRLDD